ncbi:MAG: hypothetical protein H5T98_09660 [Syntrophomonadaceae bacterium]|nr:hypothetical protein [Syntrophomonadaceae bacterium]
MNTKADIRISVRRGDGATRKIELIALPFGNKYWVRLDGKKSVKTDVTTITEVTHRLREWLCKKEN